MSNFKVLAVSSIKGGVGKTASAVSIAGAYAELFPTHKVLLIDLDPQGSSSITLGFKREGVAHELYIEKSSKISNLMRQTQVENLYIVPADTNLKQAQADILRSSVLGEKRERQKAQEDAYQLNFKIKEKLDEFKKEMKNENWFVVFDTRPDIDLFTLSALMAADRVIIPINNCEFAVEGFRLIDNYVDSISFSGHNPTLRILGIFRNKWEKVNSLTTRMVQEELDDYSPFLMETTVPSGVALTNAFMLERKPVNFTSDRSSNVSQSFLALTEEMFTRWDLKIRKGQLVHEEVAASQE